MKEDLKYILWGLLVFAPSSLLSYALWPSSFQFTLGDLLFAIASIACGIVAFLGFSLMAAPFVD